MSSSGSLQNIQDCQDPMTLMGALPESGLYHSACILGFSQDLIFLWVTLAYESAIMRSDCKSTVMRVSMAFQQS